jgi:hypothetical protein
MTVPASPAQQAAPPSATGGQQKETSSGSRESWQALLELAGAAAGIVVLLSLVGSSIMWARFYALELPATLGVSLLSRDYLLSLGASTLVLSMLLGLLAVAVLHLIRRALPDQVDYVGNYILALALEFVLILVVIEVPLSGRQRILFALGGLVAGIAFAAVAGRTRSFRRVGLVLFFMVTLLGGLIAFARNLDAPVKLDTALILLKDGSLASGAYVARTSDEVYLAPDSFNRTYGQLVTIPRAEIVRISLSEPQSFRSAGARDSTPLVAGRPDRSARVRGVEKYLAGWAGDPIWKYPPVSYSESESYLRAHLDKFVPSSEQAWTPQGARVPLGTLVDRSRIYAGQPVITRGRLLEVITPPAQPGPVITRYLVLEARRRKVQAICAVNTDRSRSFRARVRTAIRGVVVHAGTMTTSLGTTKAKGIFLQCSSARQSSSIARA